MKEKNRRSEHRFLGDVAQLEEHLLCKQGVVGSSPIISTTNMNSLLSRGADGPHSANRSTLRLASRSTTP
jgi:hypothetical protein